MAGKRTSATNNGCLKNIAHRACGFTLIELLVVVSLIAVLVAFLLPAVQFARESARRAQCASNMRQIALGVLNYEVNHERLPASGIVDLVDVTVPAASASDGEQFHLQIFNHLGGKRISWMVLVLPYLEEQALYDRFDLAKTIFAQPGDPQARDVAKYFCPTDDTGDRVFEYEYLKVGATSVVDQFAKGNYAAFVSPFHMDLQLLYPGALVAGGQRMGQIPDGASQTLLLSEVRTLEHRADQRGAWALPYAGASLLAFDMHPLGWHSLDDGTDELIPILQHRTLYEPNPESRGRAQPPNNQGPNKDTLEFSSASEVYKHVVAMAHNARMPCTWRKIPPGIHGYNSAAPRSLHPGGVNAGYLDGHVEFLGNDVDEILFSRSVSVADQVNR